MKYGVFLLGVLWLSIAITAPMIQWIMWRKAPKNLPVRFPCVVLPDRFRFYLRKPLWIDRVLERLHLQTRFRTADSSFDERIYVQSDDPVLLKALAADGELRKAVLEVFNAGKVKTIRCWRGALMASIPLQENVTAGAQPATLQDFAGRCDAVERPLVALGKRLLRIHAPEWTDSRDPTALYVLRFGVIVSTIAIVLGVAAGLWTMFLTGNDIPRLMVLGNSNLLAAAACAATLPLAVFAARWLVRGGSRVYLMLFYVLAIMGPALWFVSQAWFIDANVRSDDSVRQDYVVRVADRYFKKSSLRRRSSSSFPSCYLVIEQWPNPRINSSLYVPRELCAVPNTCLQIGYRQGSFGDPWLESIQIAPSCASALTMGGSSLRG